MTDEIDLGDELPDTDDAEQEGFPIDVRSDPVDDDGELADPEAEAKGGTEP